MKAAYVRISVYLATMTLVGVGCGQILGLDEYVLADAGGSGGTGPACGDGVVDPGEGCDDGNDTSADGCTSCSVDACYACTNEAGPSTCSAKLVGDVCATGFCNGSGLCVECLVEAHCSGNAGKCIQNKCASCTDALQNGDETEVDCGGTRCKPCEQGKTCLANSDCSTTFCVDGVCCAEACSIQCFACNIQDFIGECVPIDKYGEDLSYGMGEACLVAEGEACTGGGGLCLRATGQSCTANAECATLRCGDPDLNGQKTCVKVIGEPCTLPADCYTNICTNGLCAM